jgi:DNA (cytosine-5)-methyltransferase 1
MCIGGIDNGNAKFGVQFAQQNRVYDGTQVATALTSQMSGYVNNYGIPMFGIDYTVAGQEREISNAVTARTTRGCSNRKQEGTAVCIPVLTPDRAEKRQNGRRFKDNGEESFTLTSQDRHGVAIKGDISVPVIWYDKYKCYIAIRKLTPRECFRLQGWEDKYFERAQFVNSDSQLYKQAGNGVTVAVVEDIAKAIGKAEKEEE